MKSHVELPGELRLTTRELLRVLPGLKHARLKTWQKEERSILSGGETGHGIERTYSLEDIYRIGFLHNLTGLGVAVSYAVQMARDLVAMVTDSGYHFARAEWRELHSLVFFVRREDGDGWERHHATYGKIPPSGEQSWDELPDVLPMLAGRPAIMIDSGAMVRDLQRRIDKVLRGRDGTT